MRYFRMMMVFASAGLFTIAACADETGEGTDADEVDTLAVEDDNDLGQEVSEAARETGEAVGAAIEETGEAIEGAGQEIKEEAAGRDR